MNTEKEIKRITTKALSLLKKKGIKITALTAYDFITAKLIDEAGIDIILVGDSLSNVFQGNETTLPVTMDEMIYHTKAVAKAVDRAMVVVDLPFMSYQLSVDEGFRNAGRIMKETSAGGVKLEGGERVAETVRKITQAGIPVMGHIGLTPQSIHQFGSYRERGRNKEEAEEILNDSKIME
ncbi:MAG: 3-methyl-2-oxobutanoate hydroxymethyltransferase, partial [Ignavibacteria bacterium RIFOXYA2_FULL_37_17]